MDLLRSAGNTYCGCGAPYHLVGDYRAFELSAIQKIKKRLDATSLVACDNDSVPAENAGVAALNA